jgi:hypothetical protein
MNDLNGLKEAIDKCLKIGVLDYDWNTFKEYIKNRLKEIYNDEDNLQTIYREINKIDKIPFTIQRICELISDPEKYYKNKKKFIFSFQKLINLDF